MKIKSGAAYPNNKKKSFLYETHLHHYDFLCSPEEYAEEIEIARAQEKNEDKNCQWLSDVDGKIIVAGLDMDNPYVRIEITPDGFNKINAATKKSLAAKRNQVKGAKDVRKLFSPEKAIDDPLMFVGRHEQVKRIIETELDHGRLFLISGERSTGKTSLAKVLLHHFSGDENIAEYYGLSLSCEIQNIFPMFIDISSGISNCEQLSQEIISKMDPEGSQVQNITNKFTFSAVGIAKYERSYGAGVEHKTAEQRLSGIFESLAEDGKIIVLVVDEFDLFEDAVGLAKTLRYWTSHGLVCLILGTGDKFNDLIEGHLSLARNVIPIELGPLPKSEFKEIFYLASAMAESVIRFDEAAINLMYEASGGLPYFGQLFGYIHVEIIKNNFETLENFYEVISKREEYTIYNENVISMLNNIKEYCAQFESEVQEIVNHMPNGRESILPLASGQYSLLNADSSSIEWLSKSGLVNSLVKNEGGQLRIVDPVLRQYIIISRRNWSDSVVTCNGQ